jgi:APA family basic amino acid/polyamine antiporter
VALAVLVSALALTVDLRSVIGFSSFGVLLYYAVANASAWTLPAGRRPHRAVPAAGLVGCLLLAATLPLASVVSGLAVLGAGVAGRAIAWRHRA